MPKQDDQTRTHAEEALRYHEHPKPGKTATELTKPCETQEELSLAYTPGVAAPVREIAKDPQAAYRYTNKGNLVAVISDGSAVLGLGNVGALASKPVMEGKAVLFKRFADIDVVDIEVEAPSTDAFIDTVTHIATSFGGINLEDIAAPYCFEIERVLSERLDIPVFHDDQHGTAIIVSAGLLNALELQGKNLNEARIVCLGAGAAAIASMRLLVRLGANKSNMLMIDRKGVIYQGRGDVNIYKEEFANDNGTRTLQDAMVGADVVIGVSGPNLIQQDMIKTMADHPVVFALSNPDPEIQPTEVHAVRKDVIMATGRSDYPNQVNNVLGFPFIFRGALDVQARSINTDMQVAAVHALAQLAHAPVPDSVLKAYKKKKGSLCFGPDYIIPTPFDPRLRDYIPPAVARAAVGTGVARTPYPEHYPQIGS